MKIFAILKKPVGRGMLKCFKAFSFDKNADQQDVEAFMSSIHVSVHDYFLTLESDLEKNRLDGSRHLTFHLNSKIHGKVFVLDTPVSFFPIYKTISRKRVKTGRVFQLA